MIRFDKLPPTPKGTELTGSFCGESFVETGAVCASILLANGVSVDSIDNFVDVLERQVPLAPPTEMGRTVYKSQFVSGFRQYVQNGQVEQGVAHV